MQHHDIVVIGGSMGSLDVLKQILGGLPADLPASICIVTHMPANHGGTLTPVLQKYSRLPVQLAEEGAPLRPGRIYVAAADRHLLIEDGRIVLGHGPRENLSRPAVDPLFRSAALSRGSRVIGVVITGMLNDGAAGLAAIKHAGGLAIVQSPSDAIADSMPLSAIDATEVDAIVPASDIAGQIVRMVAEPAGSTSPAPSQLRLEVEIARGGRCDTSTIAKIAHPAALTCPSCHGVLSQIEGGHPLRFRCQVGHGFTAEVLEATQEEQVDEALRVALRIIEERVELVRRMARDARDSSRLAVAELYEKRHEEFSAYADSIRRAVLLKMEPQPEPETVSG